MASEARIATDAEALEVLGNERDTLAQALQKAEQENKRLRKALSTWRYYDLALQDGRSEDAQVFYEAMQEALVAAGYGETVE